LTPNLRQYRPIVPKRKYYQIRATSHQGGLKPHDLRRHAATYASRSGTPLEIVSKVLLRHASLSTTQIYLGKISDAEAIRWIDNLHG
jgi:integrase